MTHRYKKHKLDLAKETVEEFKKSPIKFIEFFWKLKSQPLKKEYKNRFEIYFEDGRYNEITADFFEPFIEDKHFTWQQFLILKAVENAVQEKGKRRISVRSGHGIGKTTTLAWLVIWYLFCHFEAQIPVTAPSQTQMYDALWKEVKKQLNKLPKVVNNLFEHESSYIRVKASPKTWFARAKTARKESPEALAGIHGKYVFLVIDEASGVPEEIFVTAEGVLTEKNTLMIMTSNPTRISGYFFDSHNDDKYDWECFKFSSIDCPRTTEDYVRRIKTKYNEGSDDYRIRVLGEFPNAEAVDDEGYTPLLAKDDIKEIDEPRSINDSIWIGEPIMGIDPAGEGVDTTQWVIRDSFKAKKVATERTSTPASIANKTRTLMALHGVHDYNIFIDSFGEGAKTAVELAKDGKNINAVNVGDQCETDEEKELYLNKSALIYTRTKKWLRSGGELVRDKVWQDELPTVRFRRNERSRIQIMSKRRMKQKGHKSPNSADALALTFTDDDGGERVAIKTLTKSQREQGGLSNYRKTIIKKASDPFAPI